MKRTLIAGFAALALCGASFGQAGNQGNSNPPANQPNPPRDQKSKDDTNFQKGNTDPSERTMAALDLALEVVEKKDDEKKKGKDKTGKNKKGGPIDPNDPNPQGNGPTVPNPTPTTPPTTR